MAANTDNTDKAISRRFRGFLPVVCDVETAGFNPDTDALLEVAMQPILMDHEGRLYQGELMQAKILPFTGANLVKDNLEFLGIKDPNDESRGALSESEALLPMFKSISKTVKRCGCKRAVLVGQNGNFDLRFILAAAARLQTKRCPFHPFSVLDTASLSALMYGQTVLRTACLAAGLNFDDNQAHGAGYDTVMEGALFCKIFNQYRAFAGMPEAMAE